jgi:hypothetical protein
LPYRIAQARRDLNLLLSLSDRELRDIGLGRHDIITAAWLPAGESPTDFLSQVSQERRSARKAQHAFSSLERKQMQETAEPKYSRCRYWERS